MERYISGLVSVVIPTYKRCDSLVRAVESVLGQTYEHTEVIVVNDNVPGDEYSLQLYEEIKKINDKRFVFLEQEKHINGAAARNCGIRAAKGEYIAFLDDDDYWLPEKLERHIEAFKHLGEEYGIVSSLVTRNKDDNLIMAVPPYKSGYILREIMQRTVDLSTIAVVIRRKALDDTGYFDEKLLRHQDIQLFTCLTSKYKVYLLKEYLQVINVDDGINRPSSDKVMSIKAAYYESVAEIMNTLTKKQKNKILILNKFEYAAILLKEKKYKQFFSAALGIFRYPSTFFAALKRIFTRMLGTKFRNHYVKKYKPGKIKFDEVK